MVTKFSLTDIPRDISKGEKDKLGISPFEDGLTQFIEYANTPITIALQGEWGSGKTSLMNTLKNNLCDGKNSKFFGVWINTWEYALMKDPSSALIDIIGGLAKSISEYSGSSIDKKLGDAILKFGLMAVSATLNRGTDVVNEIIKGSNKSSISEIRSELAKVINQCVQNKEKQGFIFFIDDLDRIDPPVAVQLLELLKNLFTLDHCIFVLAIDYDVVIKGLEPKFGKLSEQNEREFRSFFDKIIQVPFSMPITRYVIDEFLKESLLSINYINNKQAQNDQLISAFSEISNLSVGTNPRSIKRLLNSLLLIHCINSREEEQTETELDLLVNFSLVSIQIAFPSIYRLLSANPGFDNWDESILGEMNLLSADNQNSKSENFSENWEKILFRICDNDYYLRRFFPNILKLLNRLKKIIEIENVTIEDTIRDIIFLSSVTNLDAFDKQEITDDIHISSFLKELRQKVIVRLREKLPNISKQILPQGKRVKSNAYIKFSKKDFEYWVKLNSESTSKGIELSIFSKLSDLPTKIVILNSVQEFYEENILSEIIETIVNLYNEMKKSN